MKLEDSTISAMNLKADISTAGLTDEQATALKKRLAKAKIAIETDKARRQIRFDASSADIDHSIAAAIKLEQSEAEYEVKTSSDSGNAKTDIEMSSKGDASYRSCLINFLVFLGIIAVLAIIICANKR